MLGGFFSETRKGQHFKNHSAPRRCQHARTFRSRINLTRLNPTARPKSLSLSSLFPPPKIMRACAHQSQFPKRKYRPPTLRRHAACCFSARTEEREERLNNTRRARQSSSLTPKTSENKKSIIKNSIQSQSIYSLPPSSSADDSDIDASSVISCHAASGAYQQRGSTPVASATTFSSARKKPELSSGAFQRPLTMQ